MKKPLAIIQLAIVAIIVIYSTVSLYRGNFEVAFATLPFLLLYYVYVVARQKRPEREEKSDEN